MDNLIHIKIGAMSHSLSSRTSGIFPDHCQNQLIALQWRPIEPIGRRAGSRQIYGQGMSRRYLCGNMDCVLNAMAMPSPWSVTKIVLQMYSQCLTKTVLEIYSQCSSKTVSHMYSQCSTKTVFQMYGQCLNKTVIEMYSQFLTKAVLDA